MFDSKHLICSWNTQIQLADEKSTIKAMRKRQEKDREEMEKLQTELNV